MRSPGRRWVLPVLVVVLVAALVALGLTWRSLQHQQALAEAGSDAEAAARRVAVEMTSYDHATLKKDFAWIEDDGTKRFKDYFAEVSAPAQKVIAQLKAKAVGKVVDSAADVEDEDNVKVVLFVDQTITSAGQKGSKVDQPRVSMFMVQRDGRWLVDRVELNSLVKD